MAVCVGFNNHTYIPKVSGCGFDLSERRDVRCDSDHYMCSIPSVFKIDGMVLLSDGRSLVYGGIN